MKCYNCGAELSDLSYCTHCSADVGLYKKIVHTSNTCYNEGLAKASVRDLSGAIASLKKSLQFYKKNIQARNLLGLVYFEMGEAVAALREWVISKNMQPDRNMADTYISAIQNNRSRLDTINLTIKKYNQALAYCHQGSEDLAIIQLKKVLSLNPNLIQAHQLIALLYIREEEYDRALKSLRKVLRIDTNNTTALRYLHELESRMGADRGTPQKNRREARPREDRVSYRSGNDFIIRPGDFKENTGFSTVVNIMLGVIIGALVVWFLVVPAIRQTAQGDARKNLVEANEQLSTKSATISNLESQVEQLQKAAKEAEDRALGSQGQLGSYQELLNAMAERQGGDIAATAEILAKVSPDALSGEARKYYDSLNQEVSGQLKEQLYGDGYSAYLQYNYEKAIENLEKIIAMDEGYEDGYALYYLAQAYRQNGETQKALEKYKRVIELKPGTDRSANAERYVQQLTQ